MIETQVPGKVHRRRVADQILDDLHGQILSGALPAGTKLPAERDLAAGYGVSGPTIREAIRVLTAMGLVTSKNGTGSTVTARSDTLIAASIASVVQLEKMAARDVFGLLGALNTYAVELAARRASADEIAGLREAVARTRQVTSVDQAAADLKNYFLTLSRISHNPLLAALCRFITEVQIGLAIELSGRSLPSWKRMAAELYDMRVAIVDALEARDPALAVELVNEYHRRVIRLMRSLPHAEELGASDPGFSEFLSSWLEANVLLGGEPNNPDIRRYS
jgi:DNA-binding FadR family transcriptional regulator